MMELAGGVADGVILNLTPCRRWASALDHVGRGLAGSGRERFGFTVACVLQCCLLPRSEHRAAGGSRGRRELRAATVRGSAVRGERLRGRPHGGRRAPGGRRQGRALDRVAEDMIDEYLVHGTQEQVEVQVESYRRLGVNLPVLFPVAPEGGD